MPPTQGAYKKVLLLCHLDGEAESLIMMMMNLKVQVEVRHLRYKIELGNGDLILNTERLTVIGLETRMKATLISLMKMDKIQNIK
jgi:hypothetical protein